MSSIDKLDNGRWRARFRDPAGRSRSRTFGRKADAERFLAATATDMHRGDWVDPKLRRARFDEWADAFEDGWSGSLRPPLADIKERLGHADVLTTFRKYGHLFQGVQERLTAQLEEAHRRAAAEVPDGEVVELRQGGRGASPGAG